MKRIISLLLAMVLTAVPFIAPVSAALKDKQLDDVFADQVGDLDYFHSLDSSYMSFRVSRDLYELYLPEGVNKDEFWDPYPISAEIYESYLYSLFEVNEATLNSVKLNAEYNEAENTYMLNYIGGFGGSLAPREYQGFTDNGDGTYNVYYATINYLYLPESEYGKAEELEWPNEYEYEGKVYENGPDGYVCVDGVLKSGRKYTVSYNDKTGLVRFISQSNYTESDLPKSFDKKLVSEVIYYEMRHDLGIEFAFGENAIQGETTVRAIRLTAGDTYKKASDYMNGVANDFSVYSITARKDWQNATMKAESTFTFNVPEGYDNPKVFLLDEKSLTLTEVSAEYDAENKRINALTSSFGTFIVCNALAPKYILGDVNGNGEVEKYDYILVKRAVLNTVTLDETQLLAADVNKKDGVEKYDYILVKRHVLNTYVIGA